MVRRAAAHALGALARAVGPAPLLATLGGALVHPAWRVREEGVNAHTAALLAHPGEQFDYPACVRALAAAAGDEQPRVAAAALEAFALLHARLGALLQGMLTAVGAEEGVKRRVAERARATPQLGLPALDGQGLVQHQVRGRMEGRWHAVQPGVGAAGCQRVGRSARSSTLGRGSQGGTRASSLQAHARPPSAQRPRPAAGAPAAGAAPAPTAQQAAVAPSSVAALACAPAQAASAAPVPAAPALWAAGVADRSPSMSGGLLQQSLAPASAVYTASAAAAGYLPTGLAASAPCYTSAAVAGAPGVERSATSYSSSISMGGAMCSSSAAAMPGEQADLAPTPGSEQDGEEAVERSAGSLLNWSRPPGRKPAAHQSPAGSSPGSRGGSAGSRPAWTPQAAESATGEAEDQQGSRRAGVRSFLRPGKPSPGGSRAARSGPAPPSSLSATSGSRAQSQSGGGSAAAPLLQLAAAAAGPGGACNTDLSRSVRNWQRQQGGEDGSEDGCEGAAGQPFSQPGPAHSSQQEGLAVDGRSDSLLQWRLPPRAGSSRQAAAGLQQGPAAEAGSTVSPPRVGSASLRRTLSSFKKKIFGGGGEEAPAAEPDKQAAGAAAAARQHRQQPGSSEWSIAAVRAEAPGLAREQIPVQELRADRPGLTVVVPPPAALDAEQPQGMERQPDSPESPGKAGERLNRLRQMADRRRVWSAPLKPHPPLEGSQPDGASSADAPAVTAEGGASSGGATGQRPPSGSPGQRPGLQALKARARTARLVSGSSSSAAAGQGSTSFYSMEAVNDVFGPDKPAPGSPWSPLKAAPASGSPPKVSRREGPGRMLPLQWMLSVLHTSFPSRLPCSHEPANAQLSVATHGASSGGSQWPDSPTSSSGTPSARSASWRAAGLGGAPPSAAGSPKPGSASGFSPGAADTSPLAQPEAALAQALAALQEAATSQRRELDWQAQYEALCTVRRLARNHPAVVAPSLHPLVLLVAPVIDALRSTLSRLAIAVFQARLGPQGVGMVTACRCCRA